MGDPKFLRSLKMFTSTKMLTSTKYLTVLSLLLLGVAFAQESYTDQLRRRLESPTGQRRRLVVCGTCLGDHSSMECPTINDPLPPRATNELSDESDSDRDRHDGLDGDYGDPK